MIKNSLKIIAVLSVSAGLAGCNDLDTFGPSYHPAVTTTSQVPAASSMYYGHPHHRHHHRYYQPTQSDSMHYGSSQNNEPAQSDSMHYGAPSEDEHPAVTVTGGDQADSMHYGN